MRAFQIPWRRETRATKIYENLLVYYLSPASKTEHQRNCTTDDVITFKFLIA